MNCSGHHKVKELRRSSSRATWGQGTWPSWEGQRGLPARLLYQSCLLSSLRTGLIITTAKLFPFLLFLISTEALNHLLVQLLWPFPRTVFQLPWNDPTARSTASPRAFYTLFQEDMMHCLYLKTNYINAEDLTQWIGSVNLQGKWWAKEEEYTWGRDVQGVNVPYFKAKKKTSENFTILFP